MKEMQGKILKGIGGFYYVETPAGCIECRARGVFRNRGETPMVGDEVRICLDEQTGKGVLEELYPRKNFLQRPGVCNVDCLYIVVSTIDPAPNLLNIDKLTALAVHRNIEPCIIISKTDLKENKALYNLYVDAGFTVFEIGFHQQNIEPLRQSLAGKVSAFTGNSGVGKSTLINRLLPQLQLETGEISKKLSRGRHTTRHIELFPLPGGGYLADTPGFSSIDFEDGVVIEKQAVIDCFPDFVPFLNRCRFPDCRHIGERDCGIKQAVSQGKIASSRYESYCVLYREAEKIKDWEKGIKKGNG